MRILGDTNIQPITYICIYFFIKPVLRGSFTKCYSPSSAGMKVKRQETWLQIIWNTTSAQKIETPLPALWLIEWIRSAQSEPSKRQGHLYHSHTTATLNPFDTKCHQAIFCATSKVSYCSIHSDTNRNWHRPYRIRGQFHETTATSDANRK